MGPSAAARVQKGEVDTEREGLARTLRKHHITGIAISGTVGAGCFVTSGEILALAGSLGAVLSYAIAGFTVMCVMLCLSELVSVRPWPGAFFEFPSLYVHEGLGFASGWAYWLAYTCSCCTLTVQAAMILDYWKPELPLPLAILACWLPIVVFSFFGPVLWYGRLEWNVKWSKILLIIGSSVLMICIAAGVRGSGDRTIQPPSHQWDQHHRFPPGYSFTGQWSNFPQKGDIRGHLGAFLGVWNSITTAVFAFIGVEIVVITAGEAKFPQHDLPRASRWIYWFAIGVYVTLVILASLNVPYDDPDLLPESAGATKPAFTTGNRSPFIIAVKRAGLDYRLSSFLNGALFFAAATAANTAFYVSSRTLYMLCNGGKVHPTIKQTLGSTSFGGLPLWALSITIGLSSCAYLGSISGVQTEIVGVVQRISVTAILCVYISQCVAFINYQRFYIRRFKTNRKYKNRPGQEGSYRSGLHQPLPAIFAIVFCGLLIFFNGWDTIYRASRSELSPGKIAAGLIGSYFGPVLFAALFIGYQLRHRTGMKDYNQVIQTLDSVPDDEMTGVPLRYQGRFRQILLEMR